MRHRKEGKILHREKAAREALIRDLATNLILNETIQTTQAKAKLLRPYAEGCVTHARAGTLAGRRWLHRFLRTEKAVNKLIGTIAPRYTRRTSGFLRIVAAGRRRGDGAEMAVIQFVE
ncbi:MAG: 50S ribosomal protein L17 [bacterium]